MGTDDIRSAIEALGPRNVRVTLSYVDGGQQLLHMAGQHSDGTAFDLTSPPFFSDAKRAGVDMVGRNVAKTIDGKLAARPEDPNDLPKALDAQALKNTTDRIAAAVPIAKAIIDGRKAMGLAEKMGRLAERMQSVPKALEAHADALLPRLDALEAKGAPTFEGLASVIADAEKGVAAAEAAMRLLTNGGPLLDSAGSKNGT
jgi:hypothetical protein